MVRDGVVTAVAKEGPGIGGQIPVDNEDEAIINIDDERIIHIDDAELKKLLDRNSDKVQDRTIPTEFT